MNICTKRKKGRIVWPHQHMEIGETCSIVVTDKWTNAKITSYTHAYSARAKGKKFSAQTMRSELGDPTHVNVTRLK